MRELTQNEMNLIAGGLYCTDKEGLKKVAWAAAKDGITVALIMAPIAGTIGYTASSYFTSPLISIGMGAGVGLLVSPVAAIAGTYYSSAWNVLN